MKNNQKGNILPILLALLVIAFAVWSFFYVRDHHHDRGSAQTASTSSGASGTALSSGSNDTDLNSDLQNINSGLSQGSQQLQNTDNALNDQQLPVTD